MMKTKLIVLISRTVVFVSKALPYGPRTIASVALSLALTGAAQAQFTGNMKTNIINGVHSNWVGNGSYVVGSNTFKDVLQIINGGVLSNGFGFIGYEISGSNNVALINGGTWSNQNNLIVGNDGAGNQLIVSNGGTVFDLQGFIGGNVSSSNNMAVVTGPGSVWSNPSELAVGSQGAGNQLIVSNAGTVFSGFGFVGGNSPSSSSNVALISGGTWSNQNNLIVGYGGVGNQLIVSNAGTVFNLQGFMGNLTSSSNNVVRVADNGAWRNSSTLYVGNNGRSNVLTVAGGSVVASNAFISYFDGVHPASNNVLRVESGSLFVTNAASNGALVVSQGGAGKGELILNGGSVTVDSLIATNGLNSVITFNGGTLTAGSALIVNGQDFVVGGTNTSATYIPDGGTHFFNNNFVVRRGALLLNSGTVTVNQLLLTNGVNSAITFGGGGLNSAGTFVTNGQQFVVGDGALGADFHLLGGVHSFNNGLRIRNAATLSGCGTVNGDVTIDSGGTVFTDCGRLTFTGTVTNNYALAVDGTVLEFYGTVVNNGGILLYNGGSTTFHGTFINNGIVSNAGPVIVTSVSRLGDDMVIQAPSTNGFRYELQFTTSVVSPVWTNSGAPQSGTGGVLTFTDPGGATNKPNRFYQVDVIWP